MKNKSKVLFLCISTVVCLLPILLGVFLYAKLPSQIPIHFNSAGEADGYASKPVACFMLPVVLAGLNLIVHFSMDADPKRDNVPEIVKSLSKMIVPVISMTVQPMILFIAMGKDIPVERIVPVMVGLLLVVVGLYLPKSRQNYTVGIRLPWTLNNEDNWNKTHRMAGILWTLGGVLVIIFGLLQLYLWYVLSGVILVLICIPAMYSYILYKRGM